MTDRDPNDEIVINVGHSGESLVLDDPEGHEHEPGAFAGEARVEVDPLVEAFARSPYDPVIGSMMMGRATGEVIAHPPEIRWMRVIAYVLAVGLIVQLPITYYFGLDFSPSGAFSSSVLLSLIFSAGGLLLLVRLLRSS